MGPLLFEARCWSSCVWVFLVRLKQKIKTSVCCEVFSLHMFTHLFSFWCTSSHSEIWQQPLRSQKSFGGYSHSAFTVYCCCQMTAGLWASLGFLVPCEILDMCQLDTFQIQLQTATRKISRVTSLTIKFTAFLKTYSRFASNSVDLMFSAAGKALRAAVRWIANRRCFYQQQIFWSSGFTNL